MRRFATACLLALALSGLIAGMASGAPSGGNLVTADCDDGVSRDLNFGTATNNSSTAFIGTNTVLVVKHFEILDGGELVYSFDRGINGFDASSLLTCGADLGTLSFSITGFLSPRG